jgi:polyhydroxybutyrate depolymerase
MKHKIHLLIYLLNISIVSLAQTGTTYSVSISSGGNTRTYSYYVPTMYNSLTDTVPLIINVHGFTGSSNLQEIAHDFRKIADTANFIILHPQAKGNPGFENINNNPTSWDVWNTVLSGAEDRNFIMQALDSVQSQYNIDTNRVYVTGFSQGGYMSYNLSTNCSHRIAAMASVAGSMSTEYYNNSYPVHPLPVMEIHGTNDDLVKYDGTNNGLAVETVVGHWIQFNHCDAIPSKNELLPDIATDDQSRVVHYLFTGGCKGVSVEFYKVLDGGHQVPSSENPPATQYGVGTHNQDFTAAREVWRFFKQYRLDSLYKGVPETECVALSNPPPTPPLIPASPFIATGIDASLQAGITVYPNPTSGVFTVDMVESKNTQLRVTNLLGDTLLDETISGRMKIFHLNTPAGIYFYQITNADSLLKTGKIIVK